MPGRSTSTHELDREKRLEKAASEVAANLKSLRRAARDHGVPITTLHHRVKKTRKSYSEAHVDEQLLSPTQEKVLVDWIL